MNAHHRKASYRPQPPTLHRRYRAVQDAAASTDSVQLKRAIERVPFGWQLDAIVPDVAASPSVKAVEAALSSYASQCQIVRDVNLADLLAVDFLESHIRTGSLVALSLDDSEDADTVCLDGRGRMVLNVTKDTYEVLGLPGRASAFGSHRQRFIIELNLVESSFRAGKPGYERIKRALANWPARTELLDELAGQPAQRSPRTFDLIMSFVDKDGSARPVSFKSGSACSTLPLSISSHTLSSVQVPRAEAFPSAAAAGSEPPKKRRISSGSFRLTGAPSEDDDPLAFWEDYREWAGLVSLGEAAKDKVRWREDRTGRGGLPLQDEEEEAFGLPKAASTRGDVTVLSVSGLLHPRLLSRAVQELASADKLSTLPFLSLSLRQFAHAPLSHLSAADPPVVGTSKKPNGKKRKRGRGRGEEEEADPVRVAEEGGWDLVARRMDGGQVMWHLWEQP